MSSPPAIDFAVPLGSWTRTLPEADALTLLDLARPGQREAGFLAAAQQALADHDPAYAKTLARLVFRALLERDAGGQVRRCRLLALSEEGPPAARLDLFRARWCLASPWTLLAADRLIGPALRPGGEPVVPIAAFDALVDAFVDPATSASSRRKTRSSVVGALVQLGVVERPAPSAPEVRARRGDPHPLAVAAAIADQLDRQLLPAAPTAWLAARADAARLWCLSEADARRAIAIGLDAGSLSRVDASGAEAVAPAPVRPSGDGRGAENRS